MSRAQSKYTPGGRSGNRQTIKQHLDWLAELPRGETFIAADVPDPYRNEFSALRETPVVERVGKEKYNCWGNDRYQYQLPAWVCEEIGELLADRDTICPCGHSGIRNHGEFYTCAYDDCDEQFSRAEVEA